MPSTDLTMQPWFFCGIGGSGMLPLALLLRGQGAMVAGSDRSREAGRTPEKFAWLESLGIKMYPQDGSGIESPMQILVASAAVEDTVPEVVRAKAIGAARMSRAELLARLFNAAPQGIAVGGKGLAAGLACLRPREEALAWKEPWLTRRLRCAVKAQRVASAPERREREWH